MTKGKSWLRSLVACVAVVLIGSSLGCHPATTTGTAPTTTKPDKQPDKKGAPVKPPEPDIN